MTLRPYSIVHSLIFDSASRRISGVRVIDAQSRQQFEFQGKVVLLCASSLESARLLLNSATPEFPNGLANSSGELGHNVMDHIKGGGASGIIPGGEGRTVSGRRPNGIYMPRFRNLRQKHPGFVRGYGFQGGGWQTDWVRGITQVGFGAEFKKAMTQPGPWHFRFYGYGECLPDHKNYVELDKDKLDAWGIPTLKIHSAWGENELALRKDMAVSAAEMLEATGAKDIRPFTDDDPPGFSIHEMGTARMGKDPKTSVLNAYSQSHDVKNLFITDGSGMTSSSCVNPSLTYMALTARACDYAVQQMKRGEL
jgi:choline dehydrogenase-like flavoprotein